MLWDAPMEEEINSAPPLLKRPSGCATSAFLLSNSQNYMPKTVLLTLITKQVLSLFCFFYVTLSQKRNSG